MDKRWLYQRYREHLCVCDEIGLTLDISRMRFGGGFFESMAPRMERAYREMDALEGGAIANPDEGRMVGHYWLRDPGRAPGELGGRIREAVERVKAFAASVHDGTVRPRGGERFTDVVVIGIGGSALGPQLLDDALGDGGGQARRPGPPGLALHFLDNTDPDGIERGLGRLGDRLGSALSVVISKSGTTPETRNGMVLVRAACERAGLRFADQAAAVTGEGSELDRAAESEGWVARFPMWDWVGGRTSVTGPVGLLPAALGGVDVDALLAGAAACDARTRRHDTPANPAALLALMWHHATGGRGAKDMVVLPYKDRLLLLSRYLQQLVMESLGKGRDLDGRAVEQGIAVYGNKGSTDQHAYVQQLREGVNNFFVTFIRVLEDAAAGAGPGAGAGEAAAERVEPHVTAGDYLDGLLLGTREALHENGRESMTLTIERVDAFALGVLIALFERAVGFYASLVNVNAYHQPGVEAGKAAAAAVLELQRRALAHLRESDAPLSAEDLAAALGVPDEAETLHHILTHLAANGRLAAHPAGPATDTRYAAAS